MNSKGFATHGGPPWERVNRLLIGVEKVRVVRLRIFWIVAHTSQARGVVACCEGTFGQGGGGFLRRSPNEFWNGFTLN